VIESSTLWQRKFQSLMPFRIREILLVSSAYDAFVLEEDGSLSDRLFYEYSELSLSWAPRMTHVATAERALELLDERRFDLVVTVVRIGKVDAGELSLAIRNRHSEIPIVLLIFDEADLGNFPERRPPESIDRVFQWSGNTGLLIAVIKATEDLRNVSHDTRRGGVQVILVVEDSVRAYSSFLGMLYPQLLKQSGSLIAEGLNDFHRLMRMRARPKILLATSQEEAMHIFEVYRGNVCCLMTDMRIPSRPGETPDGDGGVKLAEKIKEKAPALPVLFQTAEPDAEMRVRRLGAWFVHKHTPDFQSQVRYFLQEALGFGDFVFRLPDRTEVARATDVYEMENVLRKVPIESVVYHASRNHFSVWLRARSLFELAERVRPRTLRKVEDPEELREDLISVLNEARLREQEGVITDLSSRRTGPENRFVRVGRGSIGGKGRGIAYVSTLIVRHGLLRVFDGLEIRIPKTVVLGTDAFDLFMSQFEMKKLLSLESDSEVTEFVLRGHFPDTILRDLWKAFENLRGPLAVRSSSLLEDSRFQPFAGVYATYMLPNVDEDRDFCFHELLRAIKAVYASAYLQDARTYLASTPHDADDQKMAVVIQQVVGQRYGSRFYPTASGVAQSYNNYPVGGQVATAGVAHLALGLGQTVVSGGVALRFSPASPTSLPQFPTATAFLEGSQHQFYALDLERSGIGMGDPDASLVRCELEDAEQDGTLQLVASVYCAGDDVIRENFSLAGPRVVSFNNILKWNAIPLAEALATLMDLLRRGMGEEVEIEFAVDMPTLSAEDRDARLYVLQVRPMTAVEQQGPVEELDDIDDARLVCKTDSALGHGAYRNLHHIVYVEAEQLGSARGRELVGRIRAINDRLVDSETPYLLIGPGRWGSSDPTLGIGVTWADIRGACVILETPIGSRRVEPSQGTHFFRNITAAHIGYMTITDLEGSWLDREWLLTNGTVEEEGGVHHIELDAAISVLVDGRHSSAVILKPET
jgi:DNA-binding NarL/FixJ family response regulator